ncbi:MAG: hypothetical protein ACYDBI_04210 [Thermoplasmataceae archaeon]
MIKRKIINIKPVPTNSFLSSYVIFPTVTNEMRMEMNGILAEIYTVEPVVMAIIGK